MNELAIRIAATTGDYIGTEEEMQRHIDRDPIRFPPYPPLLALDARVHYYLPRSFRKEFGIFKGFKDVRYGATTIKKYNLLSSGRYVTVFAEQLCPLNS